MKKVVTKSLVQSFVFVFFYTLLEYSFKEDLHNFFDYFYSQKYESSIFLLLMFLAYFIGNYLSYKGKKLTWRGIVKQNKE